jgi:uncharacterized membrane protein YhaH (DUF805 family)
MDWRFLLDTFDGRIGRQTFWFAMGVLVVAELIGHLIAQRIEGDRLDAIVDLAFTYPEFAIAVKRGHDVNIPTWLLGAFFGAGVLLDFFSVTGWTGTEDAPNILALAIAVVYTGFGISFLVHLGFKKGTPGPNRYGPDPLSKASP